MTDEADNNALTIVIDEEFRAHLPTAIARFQYLHAGLEIAVGQDVVISGVDIKDPTAIIRDFRYTLYRERIQAESADARSALLGALLR
jgi:hypothetical protein